MSQTLEAIKGGGGSIKIGATGTISALVSRELQSVKYANPNPVSSSTNKSPKASVLEGPSEATNNIPRKLKGRIILADEASSSCSSSNNINKRNPEIPRKPKHHTRKTRQIPILHSDNISLDGNGTPIRSSKPDKKGSAYIVEVVDVKCGMPDKTWATPITNRLKKLSFSKLSKTTPN